MSYKCSLTFWTAAFPGLARDLPEVQESLKDVKCGKKPFVLVYPIRISVTYVHGRLQEHTAFTSLSRNRISNMSFAICSAGEIVILAIMVGILKGLKSDENTENNTKAFSVLIAFSGGVWCKFLRFASINANPLTRVATVLCALPWFFLEKRRPGLSLPPGTSLLTIGIKQTYVAFRECLRLKQTFLYLIFYFLMGDVLNTTV